MKEENDFLSTFFNYGLVVKGDFKDITLLKEFISKEGYNLKVIYQKVSTNPLKIVEEK